MDKCKSCGKNKTEDKYILRERTTSLAETIFACIGLIFLGIWGAKENVNIFFIFLFLSGAWFAMGLVFIGSAETKKEILERLREE